MIHRKRSLMRRWVKVLLMFGFAVAGAGIVPAGGQPVRLATLNCWSGLDYRGTWSSGSYETTEEHQRRLSSLKQTLAAVRADVIALQEVNPAGSLASTLGGALGYDVVSERVNGGVKAGCLGIPVNLNEGLAMLARPELRMRQIDVWELSEGFGAFGSGCSFHFSERNAALVVRVRLRGKDVYIINTHLVSAVPENVETRSKLEELLAREKMDETAEVAIWTRYMDEAAMRSRQLARLQQFIDERLPNAPVVIMGDLNADPGVPELDALKGIDGVAAAGFGDRPTWDPERNPHIRCSTDSLDRNGHAKSAFDQLTAWVDRYPRRIDHIILQNPFSAGSVTGGVRFADQPVEGMYASDHYGCAIDVQMPWPAAASSSEEFPAAESKTEFLPICSYDTDVGFGYGAKLFILSPFGSNESIDVVAFNSTKGERWYRMAVSLPDLELRQGRSYPLALDVVLDYDKYINNSFFGIGNRARVEDKELYTREPLELSMSVSRGWSGESVSQLGIKARVVRNFFFRKPDGLAALLPGENAGTIRYVSAQAAHRYDTRNSFINPSRGVVIAGELEQTIDAGFTNVRATRYSVLAQYYATLFYPRSILALRAKYSGVSGEDLPVQMLLPIGGNATLRGAEQDRYLDRVSVIVNAEIRFPIFWRFGGVFGWDMGKVWNRASEIDLRAWPSNPVVGLRLHMDTFVVRADLGFGKETTGFYLNFGQLF